MKVLRTPDERFTDLSGYDYEPHYVEIPSGDGEGTLRVHYVDEGPADAGELIVCLHGEPSWCYLYRKMIPPLDGGRLPGDRLPTSSASADRTSRPSRTDYTYARHVEWMRAALFDELDLSGVTVVGQDWGGLIGLRLVAEHPDRFRRVVTANTGLPTGDTGHGEAFMAWQKFSQEMPEFPVGPDRRRRLHLVSAGRRWSPATTPRSPTSPTRRGRGSSRSSSRPGPTTRPADANRRGLGRLAAGSTSPSCAPSATATPSPPAPTRGSSTEVPGTRGPEPHDHRRRRPLPPGGRGPATWPRPSSTSSPEHGRELSPRSSTVG